jgi:hypothetical protein
MFKEAIKHQAKLRLAIAGPAGSGKTYTGLLIARSLANGGKIAVVDTEHGSASKYADLFSFDVDEMDPPYHPDRFVDAIKEAAAAGYSVILLDSLTHAWNGTGGLLEIVDSFAARSNSKNTFAAWKQGTPIYNKLVDHIIQSNIHIIATMRQKQEYVLEQDERGKQKPVKVGLAPIQREGFEYEFDVVMNMDNDNQGVIVKTRCPALAGGVYRKPGKDVAEILSAWLSGAPAEKKPVPVPVVSTPEPKNGNASRPLASDTLRSLMAAKVKKHTDAKTVASQQDRQIVAAVLDTTFGGEKTSRYELCKWLVGVASTKDMTQAQVKAVQDWLECKSFDAVPPDYVIAEARSAHTAALKDAGQLELV